MRLPVISTFTKGNNSENIKDIVIYLKKLVNELQKYIDSSSTKNAERYITDISVNSGWITVIYSDGSTKTQQIN